MLKRIVMVLALSMFAVISVSSHQVHAQNCTAKTNMTFTPSQQIKVVSAGWLQWLNRSYTFSCSGTATQLTCAHSSETYTFTYACSGNSCHVEAYDANGWRDEAVFGTGDVWGWTWDGGVNSGYTQMICHANMNNLQNPCTYTYGTCD